MTTQMKVFVDIVNYDGTMELQHSKSLRTTFHPPGARAPSAQNAKTNNEVLYQHDCARCVVLSVAHQMPGAIRISVNNDI